MNGGLYQVEARDVIEHPTMHKRARTSNYYPAQKKQ